MKIELKQIIAQYEAFIPLLDLIKRNNGTAMLIGGAVIDGVNGIEIKDVDIEIYGLRYAEIQKLLAQLNLSSNIVGKAFGVLKTVIRDIEIDLSVPRRENKVGIGHKGFEVELDIAMTPEEAGRRRDLTINSMYLNMHTGDLVDPFNGLDDLQKGILRATDYKTFIEDPLRVLRIMQLLPRKGAIVEKETIALCRKMADEFYELPAERVFSEWEKLLLKADKPSMGLQFLRDCGWLKHFPELNDLIGCPQNPIWHPEGDVWVHTCMVIDQAAKLRDQLPNSDWRLAYMFGALLHDVGKPSTTTPDLRAYGHDVAGVPIAEAFMKRMTNNKSLIKKVITIVGLHMRPGQLFNSGAKEPAWKRLHNKCRLDVLGWQSKADSAGRTGRNVLSDRHETSERCFQLFQKFGEEEIAPLVQGKDLIVLGLRPSKEFGIILAKSYELQLEGENKEAILLKIKNNTI